MISGDKKAYNPVSVVSTIARTSLGVCCSKLFDAQLHSEKDKFWDNDEGGWFANSQMKWFLRKVCKYDNSAHHRELLIVDRLPG